MIGYKCTDKDGCCRGFKFEVGKTYTKDIPKIIIEKGTRYFYDEDGFCYKKEPFSRVYKVKVPGPEGSPELVGVENKKDKND